MNPETNKDELLFTMAFYAMSHACIITPYLPEMEMRRFSHVLPYWKRMARYTLDHWTENSMELSRVLCKFAGVDPDQTSLGLGHNIRRDVEYQLWMAWMTVAQGLIKGYRAHMEDEREAREKAEKLQRRARLESSSQL